MLSNSVNLISPLVSGCHVSETSRKKSSLMVRKFAF